MLKDSDDGSLVQKYNRLIRENKALREALKETEKHNEVVTLKLNNLLKNVLELEKGLKKT